MQGMGSRGEDFHIASAPHLQYPGVGRGSW
ncbi:MAG: hypothetical protein AVDCRST_MAG77-5501 [uncultured Chloroflexi bacterium]|uniref:Uncharacterized protein n=1 Tax=uncultured Chloroflexota bacterium TaxID=166587 RepID=A0A6J4KAP6_9CHLR|nr:MAG: hypothetical protein AVDCRST_MAG77-5501 [uncultured Chloroflexota bacterium]